MTAGSVHRKVLRPGRLIAVQGAEDGSVLLGAIVWHERLLHGPGSISNSLPLFHQVGRSALVGLPAARRLARRLVVIVSVGRVRYSLDPGTCLARELGGALVIGGSMASSISEAMKLTVAGLLWGQQIFILKAKFASVLWLKRLSEVGVGTRHGLTASAAGPGVLKKVFTFSIERLNLDVCG